MRRAYFTTAVFTALFLNISVAIAQFIPVDQIPQQVQNQIIADVINDVGQLDMDELHFRFREWLLTQPRMDVDGVMIDSGNCNQCVPPNDDQDLSFPSVRGLKVISRKNGSVARNFKVKWRRPPRLSRPLRDRYELDRYEVYLTKDDGTYELHTIIKTTNARGNERLPRRIRFRNRELGLYTISVRPVYAPVPETDSSVPDGQLTDDKVRPLSKAFLAGQGDKKGGWTPPDLADVTPDSTVAMAFANGENPELEACILDRQHFGYTQVPGGPLVQGWIDYDEDTQLLDVEWLDCSDPDTDSGTVNQESITSVEELENFIGLRGLNLDGNSVQSITALAELSELIELNLNGNMGVNLDTLVDLQELEELELAGLNLTQIPVLDVQSLTNLNLSNNILSGQAISCDQTTTQIDVGFLDISNNALADSDLKILYKLRTSALNASNNVFSTFSIPDGCAGIFDSLSSINLAENNSDTGPASFGGGTLSADISSLALSHLNLSASDFSTLPGELPTVCLGMDLSDMEELKDWDYSQGDILPEERPYLFDLSESDALACSDSQRFRAWLGHTLRSETRAAPTPSICPDLGLMFFDQFADHCSPDRVEGFTVTRDPVNHVHHLSWDELLLEAEYRDFSYEVERRRVGTTAIEGDPLVFSDTLGHAVVSSLPFDVAYEFRIRRCLDDECSASKEGDWSEVDDYPLTRPVGVQLIWIDPVAGLYKLRWSYPQNYFNANTPDSFEVALNGINIASIAVKNTFEMFWETGQLQYGAPGTLTIKACKTIPVGCAVAASIMLLPEPVYDQEIDPPALVSLENIDDGPDITMRILSTTLVNDGIDYFKIAEGDQNRSSETEYYLDVSAERDMDQHILPLRRYSNGEVQVQVSACRRNRLGTDICSETATQSNPVYVNAAASEYASINDSLCWDDNSAGDGIILDWYYDPPDDIPGQLFLIPETYRITAGYGGGVFELYDFYIDDPNNLPVYEVSDWTAPDHNVGGQGTPLSGEFDRWSVQACDDEGDRCQYIGTILINDEDRRCAGSAGQPDIPSSPTGGPGDLNPGVWLSPDLPRQGFTFYWASDLRYDAVHEEYGNTYDLFAYWQTYQYINGFYSPVWLYAKLRQLDADDQSYGGALYYPQKGAASPDIEAGYFIVNFADDDSLSASIDINMQLDGGLYTEDMVNFEINEITTDGVVPQVGLTNNTDYNNGVWIDSNDSYKILSWQYNYLEGQIWLGFDNNNLNPRPIWANGVLDCRQSGVGCTQSGDNGLPLPNNAVIPFRTVSEGLSPLDSDENDGDNLVTVSAGTLARSLPTSAMSSQSGLQIEGELNADLLAANGEDWRRISFGPVNEVLTKTASFHDIRYLIDGAENPSSCTLQNGYCELLLTWFSDDDFFDTSESSIRAYLTRDGIEQPLDVNSCQISDQPLPGDAFVVRDYVCQLTTTGSYQFLLKNRSGSDDENIIAVSPVLSVQPAQTGDNLPTGNPAVPLNAAPIPYVPPPSLAQSSVGATAGSFNVDESGSATYQIPIITAPGSGGVVPQMALQYSSQAGNGVAGVGWSIGGTSAISRCGQTYVTDGNSTSVQLTDDDRLCLDGQRLIKVGGGTADYWSIDSEYRTEVDTLTRVRLLADVANGILSYFTVERQDGSISYYGLTSDSLILAGGNDYTGDAVYAWAQSRFEDSAGNYIDYAYSHPNGGNNHNTPIEYYLDKARYTGNLRRGTEPNATIFFNNEPKNPAEIGIGYLAGAQLTSTERLKSITSSVQDDANPDTEHLIRHYRLEYESDPYSRSLLTSLQECWHETDSTKCLEATIFVWDEHSQKMSSGSNANIINDFGTTAADKRIIDPRFADMNGDGQTDLIYLINASKNKLYVALSQPYTSADASPFIDVDENVVNNKHFYTQINVSNKVRDRQLWQLLDYNNDGYLDIIYPDEGVWIGRKWNPDFPGSFDTYEDIIGDVRHDSIANQNKQPQTVKLADINGDGYNDLLYGFKNAELTININHAFGAASQPFADPQIADLEPASNSPDLPECQNTFCDRTITFKEQTEVFDYNGDGAVDILIQERLSVPSNRSNLSVDEAAFVQQYGYSFVSNDIAAQRDIDGFGYIATLWRVMISDRNGGFDNGPAIARKRNKCNSNVQLCNDLPKIKEDNHLYMVDLNSDSLADFVFQRCPDDNCSSRNDAGVDTWNYQYNTGNGLKPATPFTFSQLPFEADQVRFIDYDGNGITDVLWSEKDNDSDFERWQILLNHYNGFANASITNGPYSGKSRGEDLSLFADLTGNGKTDHLFFDYKGTGNGKDLERLILQRGKSEGGDLNDEYDYVAHNVISAIEDGLGAMTLISYKSLVQRSVYTRGSNARSLTAADNSPVLDIVPAYYVVADVTSTSPAYTVSIDSNQNVSAESSGDSSIEYYYAGAKIQGDGRGFLGFERLGTFDPQNRILTITDYYQDFPYIGAPYRTERYYLRDGFDPWPQSDAIDVVPPCGEPDGGCLTGGFDTSLTNNGNPRAVLLSESDQLMDARVTATGSITGKPILYPYIATSNEVSFASIYDANQIPFDQDAVSTTKTTNSGYSIYGEVGQVVVEVLDAVGNTASKTTTVNSYADTNPALWHLGRLSRAVVTHQRPDISDEVRISEFDYHTETGQLIREIVEPNNTDLRITTTYTLDDFGNRTHTNVSGRGVNRTSRVVYDERGRYVIREINAMNQITMEVDTNPVTNLPEVDHFGNPLRVRNQQGVKTEMAYDPMGRQYFTATAALGTYSTIYRYSNVGSACPANVEARWYEETITSGAPTTRVCYDVLGREVRRTTEGFDGRWIHLDTRYNRTGQTSAVTEPYYQNAQVYWNHSVYDELDRPTAVISANGGLTTTEYSGLVTTIINPLEQSRTEYKNVLNETIEVIDAMGGVIAYSYDAIGRLIATDGALPGDIDQTTMSYNKLGHKLTMNDPDKGLWEYRYNVLGEILCQVDDRDMGSRLEYDDLGRVVARTDYKDLHDINACSGDLQDMSTWVYNNEQPNPDSPPPPGYGQLRQSTSMNNGETIIKTYTYDVHGRSVESTTEIDGQSFTQRTTYDQHNRVFQQFDATGSDYGVQMVYNNWGYLEQQIEAHDSGDPNIPPNAVYLEILAMDARGNVTSERYGNTVITSRHYDEDDGQLNLIQSSKLSTGDIQNLLYEFDLIGNLVSRIDYRQGQSEAFFYDDLNRLETVDLYADTDLTGNPLRTDSTFYDAAGNIRSRTGGVNLNYDYGADCAGSTAGPHAVCSAGGVSYTYDAIGNMTHDNSGRDITYNAHSKPERIQSTQGITDYRYGADRNRYKRIEANGDGTDGTTLYLGNVEFITKADGTRLFKRYIGGVAIQNLYLNGGSSTLSYTHKDHIGSIDTITEGDANGMTGQITQAMSFGAWGERRDAEGWTDQFKFMGSMLSILRNITPRGFTGHEMIDHAGIIHMNGRIYDSKLGRFLQADPNVQAPDNSQNLNRYSYVLNNPLSYTDPSGFFFKAIGKFVGKYWRQLVAVGIGIVTAGIASGAIWASLALNSAASFGVAVAGGALAGYVSTGTLNGALIGAFSAAAFYGVGSYFEHISETGGNSTFGKAIADNLRLSKTIAHGMTGGVMNKLGGGRFAHGFASAGTTQAFAKTIGGIGNGDRSFGITAARVTSAAIVGGAASELSGGKFANGAVTGAFSRAFNDEFSHAISTLTRTVQRSVQVGDLDVREWEALFNEDIVDAELDIHQLALMTDLASNYLINDTEALRNAVNEFIGDEFKGRSLVGLSKLKISIVSKVISRATGTNLKTIEQLLRADRVISEVSSIEPTLKGVANGIINGDKEVLKVFNGD